jgi:D-alanine-D-alanine ligase
MKFRKVIVLCGGGSTSETGISLASGENVYQLCKDFFPTDKVILESDALPPQVRDATDSIIFPLTIGEFGEDGGLQLLMEQAGLTFVGSGSEVSALCMNKFATKQVLSAAGIQIPVGVHFKKSNAPSADEAVALLGSDLFLKPNAMGSSIGACVISSKNQLKAVIDGISDGKEYVLERRIRGVDLSVAVLSGVALEVVKTVSSGEFLDFKNKYTAGMADRTCPAAIPQEVRDRVRICAEVAFRHCNCRDWARMDFLMRDDGEVFLLEVNTIPGMGNHSAFPMSSAAVGIDPKTLVSKLVALAAARM